jgi:hypothetical protein
MARLWSREHRRWWESRSLGLTWIAGVLLFGGFVIVCGLGLWHADGQAQRTARELQTSGVHAVAVIADISFVYHGGDHVVVAVPTASGDVSAPLLGRTVRASRGACGCHTGSSYRGIALGASLDVVYRAGNPSAVMATLDMLDRANSPVSATGLVMAAGGSVLMLVGFAAWWWPAPTAPTRRGTRTAPTGRAAKGVAPPD